MSKIIKYSYENQIILPLEILTYIQKLDEFNYTIWKIVNKHFYNNIALNYNLELIKETIIKYAFQSTDINLHESLKNVISLSIFEIKSDIEYLKYFPNLKRINFKNINHNRSFTIDLCKNCKVNTITNEDNIYKLCCDNITITANYSNFYKYDKQACIYFEKVKKLKLYLRCSWFYNYMYQTV